MRKEEALRHLGLEGNPTEDDIKKAYRKLAMKYHPDKTQGDKKLEEKFKVVSEAYQALLKPEKESQPFTRPQQSDADDPDQRL